MTTKFYSTKKNANVCIPNNKVCGYRISNDIMKKGYSDGVKAGLDNGVVNQRLSRFSTERQREEAGSVCAGNVNWINHKTGDAFNPPESAKNQFNIDRRAFKAGTEYQQTKEAQSISDINRRFGQGNREIIRPSFMRPTIHARLPIDFDKLQAMEISEYGNKVQLGKDQLEALTMVAIPDPLDTQWLTEKNRIINSLRASGMRRDQIERELEVNKPLGREQRTINKPSKNIAREAGLTVTNKLSEIKQEIDDGRAENRNQQATLVGQVAVLLQNVDVASRLTGAELRNINTSLMRLKVPKNYQAVFPGRRVIASGDFFNENKGVIAMFLMSNIPVDRSPNQPLMSWHTARGRYEPASLIQIYQMGPNRFLDMEQRTIDTAFSLAVKGLQPPIAGAFVPAQVPGAPEFDLFA